MSRFVLTARARLDLLNIWNYIAEDSIDAADKVVGELRAAFEGLADMPGKGHIREELVDPRHRVWSVYSSLIIYRVNTTPLQIVSVVHGARDLRALFDEET
jgi:plasmid stabilization system protein ParE